MTKLVDLYQKTTCWLECIGMTLLVLMMRIYMGCIFWKSGINKYNDYETALLLFENEYVVPLIPYELATFMATATELITPILLFVGLASRVSALAMLCMTAVIQFTYLPLETHYFWAMLFATIFFYGPGKISVDYLLQKKFFSNSKT